MAAWPTLKEVRAFLRMQPDANEDLIIQTALAAATSYGIGRMGSSLVYDPDTGYYDRVPNYPGDTQDLPDQAHEACLIHAARLYRRRDSVDGTIGFGDMGAVRIGRTDADVDALYANCGPVVFG